MANLVIPRREIWTQQPQGPVEVDWSNPITTGLLRSYDFGSSGRDATRQGVSKWSVGSSTPRPTTSGRGLSVTGSGQVVSGESLSSKISTGITLLLIAEKHGQITGASDFLFGETTSADADDFNWGFYESLSTGNLSAFVKNASSAAVNVGGGTAWLPDKGPQIWVMTYGGWDNFVRLYLNGVQVGSAAQTGLIKQTALNARIAGWNVSSPVPNFTLIRADVWNRNIGSDGVARLSANPWQIFAPRETRLFVPVGGGGVSLVIADSAHGHTADSPAFSMDTYLAMAESLHGHAADNLTLSATGAASLVVQEAAHAHIADSISLTTSWLLSIADALHSHAADNLSLDTSNATFLTVQDALHSHGADSLGFSLDTWLAIVDTAHAHTADAPTLSASVALLIAEALHAHYADATVLSLPGETTLTPEDITAIAAAVLAALNATTIPVNMVKTNGEAIIGNGIEGNKFRSHLVG